MIARSAPAPRLAPAVDIDGRPCEERDPTHGWRCGDWPYARARFLYRKGHGDWHAAVGDVPVFGGGTLSISTQWWTVPARRRGGSRA